MYIITKIKKSGQVAVRIEKASAALAGGVERTQNSDLMV